MSTAATLDRHLRAVAAGVEAIMGDYTEASILFTPEGPLKGRAAIRSFFERFLASSPPELIDALSVLRKDVDGEFAYILWKAEPFIPLATDTFLIRDEKILMQSFAALAPAAPSAADDRLSAD